MQKTYEFTVRDIFGGDGNVRFIEVEQQKLTRTRSTKRTRSDIGITQESALGEVVSEKMNKEVYTFRFEGDTPVLRLGGSHGKFWGALKEAKAVLYSAVGDTGFRAKALLAPVQVLPVWVPLEVLEPMKVETLPQILNTGGGNTMITQMFDVIPKARFTLTLVYPEALDHKIAVLLDHLRTMSMFNKRRATVVEIKELSEQLVAQDGHFSVPVLAAA